MKGIGSIVKKITYKQMLLWAILVLCFAASMIFVHLNYSFYDRPIATVIDTSLENTTSVKDSYDNKDKQFTQAITAEMKNGAAKGEKIELVNDYSSSGAYDEAYRPGNDLFVVVDKDADENHLTGSISDVKRDKYLMPLLWIFIFTLLIIGKRQGLFAVISLAVNALLLSYALDIYVAHSNISLLLIAAITAILFTIISLGLVNGFNEKTYAAILSTLAGTFASVFIAFGVLWLTAENGIYYEAMDFLTRPYQVVFLAGLFVGSLGAVMDVAITMASSVFELYEKNNQISNKALKISANNIGKDIMGTMTSILFFAYISGTIPMLILYLKNASPLGFTLSLNLSLELARALAGGIGIVLTIPIGRVISIFFVNRKRRSL